jgi:hypothetical protein
MVKDNQRGNDIFSKPLPVILADLEAASAEAHKAAEDARTAGEAAAQDVMKRLRKLFLKMAKDIQEELDK